jgi:FkbM family methyltransferase
VLPAERADAESLAHDQSARIQTYVAERGWELVRLIDDLSEELAGIDKLVVTSADRLGAARRLHDMIGLLDSKGVHLVCIEQQLDTGAGSDVLRRMLPMLAGWDPGRVRGRGLAPATVIDVGVAAGTPELYEAFPHAYHVLIEPLREFEQSLKRIVAEYAGEYHLTAVGASEGSASLRVDASPAMSSFLEPAVATRPDGGRREVPITTLDALQRKQGWTGPYGLKVDVEGYEHRVIEGAAGLLEQTEFVIAESSVSERFEGGIRSDELIALMQGHGFAVADVLGAGTGRLGAQADLLFLHSR